MPLNPSDRELIARFRDRFEAQYRNDERFFGVQRYDRPDESTLATRFEVGPNLWLELTVRPFLPQARAGILTDDRWKSEDLEQAIEDTGDTMEEFVEMGFDEAGLAWKEPPVEHYRDQGKHFYFATPLELEKIGQLGEEAAFDKLRRMFEGYYRAFEGAIRKASA